MSPEKSGTSGANGPRSISPPHVVTGATGFVGSALILELLQRTRAEVFALVRPKADQSPQERLNEVLNKLIDGHELPQSLRSEVASRVHAVAGDIERPFCGVEIDPDLSGAEFWHCAASLQYQDRHRAQIEHTNVAGTANVLDFAKRSDCSIFNMVSTAYVVGSRRGLISPEPPDIAFVNNCYERSKIMAEEKVIGSGLTARIMRPSVVIGHSQTQYTTSSDGLYGFVRNLTKFRNALERTQPGLAKSLEVSIIVDPVGRVDLVPVDSVVADAVGLSNADAPPGYYHLTNPTPPPIVDAVAACFELSGLAAPKFVSDPSEMTSVDLKLQQRIDFYSSYIINAKQFDRSSVRGVLGGDARQGSDLEGAALHRFCTWYLDRLPEARRKMAVLR